MKLLSRAALLGAILFAASLYSQEILDRIEGPIDNRSLVWLRGNHHPLARAEFDAGPAASETRMERMILLLQPAPTRQQALETLLEQQQDPESPLYHQWLTPDEFDRRFGVSERDFGTVVGWLEAFGFTVEPGPGRRQIVFSGTAAQVESAFHTSIHVYAVNGEAHRANATDPRIPRSLAGVVAGVVSLHDFASEPQHAQAVPEFTSGSTHYLAPADFAVIYDLNALYGGATDGTGQSIAIAGRSNIVPADVQAFRSRMSLAANNPVVVVNGKDPGVMAGGEQTEAQLDVEWAGAVARNATIRLVVSASTATTDGIALSAQYIVNHNVAPVVSLSFGLCEAALGTTGNQFWNALWQQAAAQGMSVFVASGDNGAAACDDPAATKALSGPAVNALCSSPYSTCVGGTGFNDNAAPALYWSNTSSPATLASALSYIPESAWNESGQAAGGSGLWAGSGGASIIYPKPAWQTGPGVPAANHRYVPDVALSSAAHDAYLVCLNGQYFAVSGTSAATPAFAGMVTLAVERQGVAQGNVNPNLYALAAAQSNGGPAVFHDVTAGNNTVPGAAGFSAGTGYDEATGLGSADGYLLVNSWKLPPSSAAFQVTAAAPALSVTQSASGTMKLTVTTSAGFNSAVSLSAGVLPAGLTAGFAPASLPAPGAGSSTLTLSAGAQTAPGVYNLVLTATAGNSSKTVPLAVTVLTKCVYSLSPTSTSEPATAATDSVTVTTTAGCAWTAAAGTSWITLNGATSGSGSGKLSYTAAANSTTSVRTGSITLAGLTFTVNQAAPPPATFSLSATQASVGAAGGSGTINIVAPSPSSSWKAASNVAWITLAATSGTGSKALSYSVSVNTVTAARTGTITAAGVTFTVTQAAASCAYSIRLGPVNPGATSLTGSISVQSTSGCAWTAVSNAGWITVSSGASGTGNGTVNYAVAVNTTNGNRTGSLQVAGYTLTVTEGIRGAVRLSLPVNTSLN